MVVAGIIHLEQRRKFWNHIPPTSADQMIDIIQNEVPAYENGRNRKFWKKKLWDENFCKFWQNFFSLLIKENTSQSMLRILSQEVLRLYKNLSRLKKISEKELFGSSEEKVWFWNCCESVFVLFLEWNRFKIIWETRFKTMY